MFLTRVIRRVAVVGTGVIGASWATHYVARGFDVVAASHPRNCLSATDDLLEATNGNYFE